MNVKLEVGERLSVPNVLPKEGSALTLIIVKHIMKKIEITPEEVTKWEIQAVEKSPGVISYIWEPSKVEDVEFEFSVAESDLIQRELNKLDQQNKLNFGTLMIFEKFCNPKPA
jgi:hypothetical protein